MKKFLEDLKKELELKGMSKKEIEDIINDHEEMISQAIDDGVSEEDLNSRFGSPKVLADELAFDEKSEPNEKEAKKTLAKKMSFKLNGKPIDIVIDLVVDDVSIELSDDQEIHVLSKKEIKEDKYEVSFNDNELRIVAKNKNKSSFFSSSSSNDFKIFIPEKALIDTIMCNMVNGDLEVNDLTSNSLKLSGVNGDLELEKLITKKAKLNIVNGDIVLKSFNADQLIVSLVSGDMEIKHAEIEHDLILNTVSGDFQIRNTTCDTLELHTVSGDIDGEELYPNRVKLQSVSGDINIENKEKKDIEIVSKSTISGHINIEI
ncbi:DUF4097 family beta strand repeat-containing protein [Mariniplasma anaerobium]|uniref:DUF4097 domain-containing protein n=1 Tax=Mariniplasma anaerobium TaxID=2735436 RepID=A0A7U9XV46_9MOLU|nr:DUF4097 family beta strand repeat-containing protein [Mariniplasma anaerobium]BCR35899.1 hypothetical protein MPAN_007920 [Mariniplasma anaerobium]